MSDTTYYVLIKQGSESGDDTGGYMNAANAVDSSGNYYFISVFNESAYTAITSTYRELIGFVETTDLTTTLNGYYFATNQTTAFTPPIIFGDNW